MEDGKSEQAGRLSDSVCAALMLEASARCQRGKNQGLYEPSQEHLPQGKTRPASRDEALCGTELSAQSNLQHQQGHIHLLLQAASQVSVVESTEHPPTRSRQVTSPYPCFFSLCTQQHVPPWCYFFSPWLLEGGRTGTGGFLMGGEPETVTKGALTLGVHR